jgi:GH35 family endo-1,4-beta-xylanase
MQYHVGPQSLWKAGNGTSVPISRQTTADVIRRIGELGIQVHITEIDVGLCDPKDTEPCVATPEKLAAQA